MATPLYEREEEQFLLACCAQGDRQAFETLWKRYEPRIVRFICLRVAAPDEAEDLAQETFIRAWNALVSGTQVAAFAPYLYTIARHVVYDWKKRSHHAGASVPPEELQSTPASGLSPAQATEAKQLWEFLSQQLDAVLIQGARTLAGKHLGYLRKLAFMAFYADGLTLPQLLSELAPSAQALGLPRPTLTQLNNWLSRGDILNRLVERLVQDHADVIVTVTRACLDQLTLPPLEADIARWRWHDGLALETIAHQCQRSLREVSDIVEGLARRLVPLVSAHLKANLHDARTRQQP
jgi:RNA polymerase sigma-70 factor (ECF subfamily)